MAEKLEKPEITESLSEKTVKELPTPETGNWIFYFAGQTVSRLRAPRGFGVRVTAGGAKSYILNYRIKGQEKRLTIAACGDWSLERVLAHARGLRERVDKGEDPLADRIEERSAPTVAYLCDLYEKEHLPRKRPNSIRDDKSMIRNIIKPKLGRKKVAEVTRPDIKNLHLSLQATPYRANRVVALLSKMFSLAVEDWGMRSDNPAAKFSKVRFEEPARARYLKVEEIKTLSEVLANYADKQAARAIRLLLLTGARKTELLSAPWSQFDLDASLWVKPSSHTKQKKEHRVQLSDGAVAVLREILASAARDADGNLESPFVFPGRRPGKPLTEIRKAWREVREAAKVTDVRAHDLRHSYATLLASGGASLPMIGKILGHTQASTTQRYAHLHDDPLKRAADMASAIITGKKAARVSRMKRA